MIEQGQKSDFYNKNKDELILEIQNLQHQNSILSELNEKNIKEHEASVLRLKEINEEFEITNQALLIAKENAEKSEEKYRTLVQYSSDPIFCFNPDETYRFVNEYFARTFGKSPEEIIGKTPHDLFPDEEAEKRLSLIREVFKTKERGEIEVKVISHDENVLYYITFADPVFDEQGQVTCVSCISKNITERKNAEIRIRQQNEELLELNRVKDRLFSIIAHDLRNPFNSILGFGELVQDSIEREDIREIANYSRMIQISSKQAYILLNNLLEWSLSKSGKILFNPEKIDIEDIINESIELLTPNATHKNLIIKKNIENGPGLFADKNMINTVIRNLLANSIKYSNNLGTININATHNGKETIVSIKDNGQGIKEEDISKLFSFENQVSTEGTYNEKGTGLGLILCKEFVEKHHGEIWVESEYGKGATFHFSIPC
jgi:PAS domain S-box-containing protein